MTIQNPPIFIQAGSHPAEDVRRWIDAMVEGTEGVYSATDLAVTEKSGTPDMSVDVAGGRAFVTGTEATYQGTYFFENRGTSNVVIAASDPTNPRIDLIVARVRDAAYSGATNTVAIEVVTGTAAASPVAPALPDNCLLLATVAVAALATSIVDANITDNRVQTYALGVADAQTRLTAAETDLADRFSTYDSTTTDTATTTGVIDLGVSVTWTAKGGYSYKVEVEANISSSVATDSIGISIADGLNNIKILRYDYADASNRQHVMAATEILDVASTQSITRKGRVHMVSGSGNVKAHCGALTPGYIIVTELGPTP